MKNIKCILIVVMPLLSFAQNNSILGTWKAIDDATNEAEATVELFEENGIVYGRIDEIFRDSDRKRKCTKCPGDFKDKPILGLTILSGLTKDGDEYTGGKILDPKHGRIYDCYITLINKNKLKIRGYLGISLFGRTQYWYRTDSK